MAEGTTATATAVSSPPSPSPFSSSFRFIRFADPSTPSPTPTNHFELDERDVFWPPESSSSGGGDSPVSSSGLRRPHFPPERFGLSAALAEDGRSPEATAAEKSKVMFHQSAPVNVPAWPERMMRRPAGGLVAEEEEEAEEEILPPHLIVARSHVMKFSVFEGVGRTLKGRDLRRVRNAVFRKTGFLD